MNSNLLSLRAYLVNRLSWVWVIFLILLILSLTLTYVSHNKILYLGGQLYPLQRNLYHFKDLVDKNNSYLQVWIYKQSPEVRVHLFRLINKDLPKELDKIRFIIDKYPHNLLLKQEFLRQFKFLIWEEWKLIDIASSPGHYIVQNYYSKKFLPSYFLLNQNLTGGLFRLENLKTSQDIVTLYELLGKIYYYLIDYISPNSVYNEQELKDLITEFSQLINNNIFFAKIATGSKVLSNEMEYSQQTNLENYDWAVTIKLLSSNLIFHIKQLMILKQTEGLNVLNKEIDKNYFKSMQKLQKIINLNLSHNQRMIDEVYKQLFDLSFYILVIILTMVVVFTIWGLLFIRNIVRLIIKPIENLIKNLGNLGPRIKSPIYASSTVLELNKLIQTIKQMIAQRFLFEDKIKRDRKTLSYLAYYDIDIKTHNYHYLIKSLRHIKQQVVQAANKKLVLVLFKIFNLDNVENLLGKKKTTSLLLNFSNFIANFLQPQGELARVNYTDFVLYVVKDSDLNVEEFLQSYGLNKTRLQQFISDVPLDFSVGVASLPDQASDINQLIAFARFAAIKAHKSREHNIKYFDLAGEKELMKIAELETDLFSAIRKEQIFLLFQPIIKLSTGDIIGCEVLVRWAHPKYGIIPPLDFISIAERNYEIIELGKYIQEQAIALYSKIAKLSKNKFIIAINASIVEINTKAYALHLLRIAKHYNVPPSAIEIEITETVANDNFEVFIENINRIRALGFLVAIDDFGTGYSSLERLQKLKVDLIKIDKTFLSANSTQYSSLNLLKIICDLGKLFKTDCLIEGVETECDAAYVQEIGIKYAQGFYFYKPMTEEELINLLRNKKPSS